MKQYVGNEFRTINNLLVRCMENKTSKSNIDFFSMSNMWIIAYIAENSHKNVYQKDLEEVFSLTRSTISKVLNLMEQKNLIIRKHVPQDARLKKIVLTDKAREIFEKAEISRAYMDKVMLAGFSDEEKPLLMNYLKRIRENIYNELMTSKCQKEVD